MIIGRLMISPFPPFLCPGLLFRLDRQPRLDPSVEAAVERMRILPTILREHLRHTGARSLVRSSAVGDDCTAARNLT